MRESSIEKSFCNKAKKDGWLVFKLSNVGNGMPDRLFLKFDKIIFIEFKTKKGILSDVQKVVHEELRSKRFVVHTVNASNMYENIMYI